MASLEWSDALSLDLPIMDDTHREFVELLAIAQRSADEALSEAWQQLVDHTAEHFGKEDRWMLATRFSSVNCHTPAAQGGAGGDAGRHRTGCIGRHGGAARDGQ